MTSKPEARIKHINPFGELIGLKFRPTENGVSRCEIEVEEKLLNPHKVVHGGVIYSMADTGMGRAVYTLIEKTELCATIEIKISYFKPVFKGTLTCDTKTVHKGKSIAALDSEIRVDGELVAKASGEYFIFTPKVDPR